MNNTIHSKTLIITGHVRFVEAVATLEGGEKRIFQRAVLNAVVEAERTATSSSEKARLHALAEEVANTEVAFITSALPAEAS